MSERPNPVTEKIAQLAKRASSAARGKGSLTGEDLQRIGQEMIDLGASPDQEQQPLVGDGEVIILGNNKKGRRFTPVGSKESVVLGLKEWEVISRLPYLPQAVSGPDLVEMFFGEQISSGEIGRKKARNVIHSFIKPANSKLSRIGWTVFNTKRGEIDEQKGGFADARWGLTRIESLSEADREALGFPIRVHVVVNGDRVYIGPKQADLLRFLVSNPGKDMTSRELSLGAFRESDHRKAGLKDFWVRLKIHLASFPVLSLSTSGLANVRRKYRLDITDPGVKVIKIGEEEIIP